MPASASDGPVRDRSTVERPAQEPQHGTTSGKTPTATPPPKKAPKERKARAVAVD